MSGGRVEAHLENGRLNSLSPEALAMAKEHPIAHWTVRRSQVWLVVRNIFIDVLALGTGAGMGLGAHHLYEGYLGRVSTLHRRVWAYAGATFALSWTLLALQLRERMLNGYAFGGKKSEIERHCVSETLAEGIEKTIGHDNLDLLVADFFKRTKEMPKISSDRDRVLRNKHSGFTWFAKKLRGTTKLQRELQGWFVKGQTSCRWDPFRQRYRATTVSTKWGSLQANPHTYMAVVPFSEEMHRLKNKYQLDKIQIPLMRLVPITRRYKSDSLKHVVLCQGLDVMEGEKSLAALKTMLEEEQRVFAKQLVRIIAESGLSDTHPNNIMLTKDRRSLAIIDTKPLGRYSEPFRAAQAPVLRERCAIIGLQRLIDCGTPDAPEEWLNRKDAGWPEVFRQEAQVELNRIREQIGWRVLEWAQILPVY